MKTKELFLSRQSSIGNSPRIVTIKNNKSRKLNYPSCYCTYAASHCSPHAATTGKNKKHLPKTSQLLSELLETSIQPVTILKSEKETNGTEVDIQEKESAQSMVRHGRNNGVSIGKSAPATFLSPLWMRCKAPPTTNIK